MFSWVDEERARQEVRGGDRAWYSALLQGYQDWEDHYPLRGVYVYADSPADARTIAERDASDKEGIVALFAIRLVDELGLLGFKEVRDGASQVSQ